MKKYQFITPISLPSILVSFALHFSSCANQIPPGGGPLDETGPSVVSVYPEPFSLNVSTNRIDVEFDEYVDKRTAQESIFISPAIEDAEFEWFGSLVEISFESSLKTNTTYTVTIGTDVTDLEPTRKNRMTTSVTFAFSTGPSIDRGLLAGRVYPRLPGDEMRGVMVYAYELASGRADTLNVLRASPTYVTQASSDGSFAFRHVRLSRYLVVSIRDASRNVVYDREEDEFGVPPGMSRLSGLDTSYVDLVLQLAVEDTTGPRVTGVKPRDRNHILVEFSEPIDTSAGRRPTAVLSDTSSGDQLSVYAIDPLLPDGKSALLATDFQIPEVTYRLTFVSLWDAVGNAGHPLALTRLFDASDVVDSLLPAVKSSSVRDSARNVPVMEEILITFTEPIQKDGWNPDRATLIDLPSQRRVPTVTRWLTESILGIRPRAELESVSWYSLTVLIDGLKDWKLESVRDSALTIRFQTEDVYNTGTIEGRVIDDAPVDTAGTMFIVAAGSGREASRPVRTTAAADGSFTIRRLVPGQYTVHAFRDRNGDGVYDPGLPYPYRASERRSNESDTLKVRSRWPLEGVLLHLP